MTMIARLKLFLILLALALASAGCDDAEDRIAELAGEWEGFCFYDAAGTGTLRLTIGADGYTTGYESAHGRSFQGRASYYGGFYLSAPPVTLDGYRDGEELRGSIDYDDGATTDTGNFLIQRIEEPE